MNNECENCGKALPKALPPAHDTTAPFDTWIGESGKRYCSMVCMDDMDDAPDTDEDE